MAETGWQNIVRPEGDTSEISAYTRTLPHWRLEGPLYFVTFRLADSIPKSVLQGWKDDVDRWMIANGVNLSATQAENTRQYNTILPEVRAAFEREQSRRHFVELDKCHGSCVLRNPAKASIVADTLRHFHGTRLRCGDFVVMPNHVHWLVIPEAGFELEDILQSVKRWTATQINRTSGTHRSQWRRDSFDRIVRSPSELDRTRAYIEENPRKTRLREGEYHYYRAEIL